jgi:SAM-dependent methyltransferase
VTEDWRALNRANWDERTALHLAPGGYDFSSHRAGRGRLDAVVEAELGPVAGLRVLHLQSHLGDDSIAIAQRGAAEVVGVDFSPPAVAAATALAAEVGATRARFVTSDLYAAPEALPDRAGGFDLVFTSWGTIGWLPDIAGWARVVAHFLRPGGAFHFADAHPAALVFNDQGAPGDAEGRPAWLVPYFERAPQVFDNPADYMNETARVANSRTVTWMHPLSDILGALLGAGLRLEWLHEHPRVAWQMFPGLVRDAEGMWTWPGRPWLPLALSLRAVKG